MRRPETVELIRMHSDRAAHRLGFLEQGPAVLQRPGAFLAIGIAGESGVRLNDGRKRGVDGLAYEVRGVAVDGRSN